MTDPLVSVCANPDCLAEYVKKTHNQKYCTNECCKIVTNKRIMVAYHEDRARRKGKKRLCKECKFSVLSRYNPSNVCQPCLAAKETERRQKLLLLIGAR